MEAGALAFPLGFGVNNSLCQERTFHPQFPTFHLTLIATSESLSGFCEGNLLCFVWKLWVTMLGWASNAMSASAAPPYRMFLKDSQG